MRFTVATILLSIALGSAQAGFAESSGHDFEGHGLGGGGHDFSGGYDDGGHGFGGGFQPTVEHQYDHIPTKTIEQTKPVHIPVVKKNRSPRASPCWSPRTTMPQPVAVPIYKLVPQEIEKKVPITVEKLVPIYVKKPYKIVIEKHHPVYINKPYPVHVPVYKHVYHHVPSHGKH
ncbi:hypothetical protein NQ314_005932 [Rhamnusium bicolor]|uniref:Uncharacterized protein n=1 Tax=Rhamnusium bicolor TaxID=1586634 RepID=A0AAV8ZBS0_9CUCU|nr:hypothetical protein NQ314_005932 [Rhamnusium bicolor]